MRFHMGFSFNLWKLKKYFIPFILGILGFLGLSMFSCIKVNALDEENIENEEIIENENTSNEEDNIDYEQLYYYLSEQNTETITLTGFASKVPWFVQPLQQSDVLINIYVALIIYIFGFFVLKFITIIHNTKWKG